MTNGPVLWPDGACAAMPDGHAGGRRRPRIAAVARVAAVAVAVSALLAVLLASPLFAINRVTVNGNERYDDGEIIGQCGSAYGKNGFAALAAESGLMGILSMRVSSWESAIKENLHYVKSVEARYCPPGELRIEVAERGVSVAAPYLGGALLVDDEGFVVDVIDAAEDAVEAGFPIVVGLEIESYALGEPLGVGNVKGADAVEMVVGALRQADREGESLTGLIASIDVTDKDNVTLRMRSGMAVNIGDGEDVFYRVSATKEIVQNGLGRSAQGYIDFTSGPRPLYVPPDANDTGW